MDSEGLLMSQKTEVVMSGGAAGKLLGIAMQILMLAIIVSLILLFVGMGILVLLHVCTVGRAFWRIARGDWSNADDAASGSRGVSPDDLNKLPCYDYVPGEFPDVDCAVCLENFRTGERCRVLPRCKHRFHAQCVDSWLSRSPVCPICRARFDGDDDHPKDWDGGEFGGLDLRESRRVVIGCPVSGSP